MAFAALIAAYQAADEGEAGLRALLPMAGRTLLENQVRRAVSAGASHAVVLVERVPAALSAAIDRLKRDGIAVSLARDPMDAADHFHPEELILLVADGLVAAPDCFEAMAARSAPTLLVVADTPENEDFERVDADHRWAGLALTRVDTLAATAAMLGEWDLQSTLMRRIVQESADYLPVDGEAGIVVDARDAVLLAAHSAKSRTAGRSMLRRHSAQDSSWPDRYIFGPLASRVAPPLIDRGVEAVWLRLAAIVAMLASGTAFWFGWLWTGLVPTLLSGPLWAVAGRIDLAQLRSHGGGFAVRLARGLAHALAMLAMGCYALVESGEIAFLLAAVAAVCLLFLVNRSMSQTRKFANMGGRIRPWLVDDSSAIWIILPFAVSGLWFYWPAAIAIYAYISLILLQNITGQALDVRSLDDETGLARS